MGRKKSESGPGELPKSVLKNLPTGFAEEAEGMDAGRLKAAIIAAETSIREATQEMKQDDRLNGAKELVKDYAAGYRDVFRAQKAKIAYVLHLLDGRGEL